MRFRICRRALAVISLLTLFILIPGCGGGGDGGDDGGMTGPSPQPNQDPSASISEPGEGESFAAGTTIDFEGSGSDPEDGSLSGDDLVWASDTDGEFGTGQQTTTSSLSADDHTVTLTATDSDGATDTDQVSITVSERPSASISSPEEGATFAEGEEITFEGSASDPEDGNLTGDALVWESDTDGQLGTGQTVSTSSLSANSHTISLTATDSDGIKGETEISLTVEANELPTASISSPADGASVDQDEDVNFQGSGNDPEDGTLTGDALVWDSDLDGQIGTGESFTRSDLAAGNHKITLTVTDSRGATDTESIDLAVEGPPTASISSPSDQSIFDEGNAVTLEGSASDPTEGELGGSSLEWSSDVDGSLGTGETITTSSLSGGPHAVTLTATDADGNTASATIDLLVESPGFDIRLRFLDDFSASERQAIRNSLDPWLAAITGDLRGGFPPLDAGDDCLMDERGIDDLAIAVQIGDLDGPGGTLAQARPCLMRMDESGNFTTASSGIVTIDLADLSNDSDFVETVTHEVGHVLGIGVGNLKGWGSNEQDLDTRDPFFTGTNTVDAFDELVGSDAYLDRGVPLANTGGQGTFGAHWREFNFDDELMTGVANAGVDDPLSRISIAALEDIGYEVDLSAADDYSLPMPQRAIWLAEADATLSRPASSGENFGVPNGSALSEFLVAGSNNDNFGSSDPENEVFSGIVRFDVPSGLPSGVTLDVAFLRLEVAGRNAETTNHDVVVRTVTSSWTESGVTWDTRPSFSNNAVGAFDFQLCNSCLLTSDLLTNLAAEWLDGTTENHGLLLNAPDADSDPTFSVGYGTQHASSPAVQPGIRVEARSGGSAQSQLRSDQKKRPRGNDIGSGLLYGIDSDGRVIRVEEIQAGFPNPETGQELNEGLEKVPLREAECCDR